MAISIKALQTNRPSLIAPNTWTGANVFNALTTVAGLRRTLLQFAALGANYSTTSTTALSTGTGITIAATPTGQVFLFCVAAGSNNTLNATTTVSLYRSTTGIPAQGSGPNGGDVVVATKGKTAVVAGTVFDYGFLVADVGLTVGTTYYYYIAVFTTGAGSTATIDGSNEATTIGGEPV